MKKAVKILSTILGIFMIVIALGGLVNVVITLISEGSSALSDQIMFIIMETICLVLGILLLKTLKKAKGGLLACLIIALVLFVVEYFVFYGLTLVTGFLLLFARGGLDLSGLGSILSVSQVFLFVFMGISLVSIILHGACLAKSK